MESFVLIVSLSVGILCAGLSGGLCLYFARSDKEIGQAVAIMLFGEFMSLLMTSIFAYLELRGTVRDMHPYVATLMRFGIYTPVALSTINLARVTIKIQNEDRDNDS